MLRRFRLPVLTIALGWALPDAPAQDAPARSRPAEGLVEAVRAQLARERGPVEDWYARREYRPAWDAGTLGALAQFLAALDRHGLRGDLFHLDRWLPVWQGLPPADAEAARVEIATTHLALFAIQSLAYGFVDPSTVHPKWEAIPQPVAPASLLDQALAQGPASFAAWLEEQAPPRDPRYRDLVSTLARYREIARLGGWKSLPAPARPVGPGQPYSDVPLLRARLRAEGDLPASAPQIRTKLIDPETAAALKSFQFRHGIDPDAVIGPQTLVELNQPVERRLGSLTINLDRLRWMPRDYERASHLEVNIAEGALRLFSDGRSVDTMRVIVGIKGLHQTPVFHGRMRHLFFRPYWNVPPKIARDEVIPEALADPGYVAREGYEIVPAFGVDPDQILPATPENLQKVAAGQLSIRQGTGPHNALGLVKFIFPNDQSVYLHDTPNHGLFQATDRDFSHGCVRVSKPDQLADFVLRANGGWTLPAIQAAMQDQTRPNRRVDLKAPLPVYLVYWTSTIMDDGRVRFDQDIYGHDAEMLGRFGLLREERAVARPQP